MQVSLLYWHNPPEKQGVAAANVAKLLLLVLQ